VSVAISLAIGEGAGLHKLVVVIKPNLTGFLIKGDGSMVPGLTVVEAISVKRPIGGIVVTRGHTITGIGVDPQTERVRNVRPSGWPENKIIVFIHPGLTEAIRLADRGIKARPQASVGPLITMIKIELPTEISRFLPTNK